MEQSLIKFAHIGMPKAASTWLQDGLLTKHPELDVVTRSGRLSHHRALVHALWKEAGDRPYLERLWGGPRAEDLRRELRPDRTAGISDEELSNGGLYHYDSRILPQLQALFGTIKVVLILRDPRAFLRSAYSQYVQKGGTQSMAHFFHPRRCERLSPRLDYRTLVNDCVSLFGSERVLLLPFEILRDGRPQYFIDSISDFLGVSRLGTLELRSRVNTRPGLTRIELPLALACNRLDWAVGRKLPGFRYLPGRRLRVLTRRVLKPVLRRLPSIAAPSRDLLARIPRAEEILTNERFAFWHGELGKYNYDVERYFPQVSGDERAREYTPQG